MGEEEKLILDKFLQTKPKIHVVKRFAKSENYFAPGLLVYIENGRGDLFVNWVLENDNLCYNLQFKDKTLFQLQGDEYFCPTCEKIVRTAYKLEQTDEFCIDKINQEGTSFEEAVNEISPMLGLLESGFYCLWNTQLYPTDGNGNLFWDYPNDSSVKPGSCIFYFGDGEWGSCIPHYMIATQPKKKLNVERVQYYKLNPNCRAIAYYMDGNITALLDGHHKAMAAAMEHRPCNSIVISKCTYFMRTMQNGEKYGCLEANEAIFKVDELQSEFCKDKYLSEKKEHKYSSISNWEIDTEDIFPGEIDTRGLSDFYPSVKECVSMDIFGPITNEYIDKFLHNEISLEETKYDIFMDALAANRHERLFEVIDYILHKNQMYEYMISALEHLFRMPHTDNLEKYLIDYVVEVEDEHPEVGMYIMQNLW